ncbi:MAG: hypothetical protein KDD62_06320 [Bdellovibrionales bacterium]|nr:hypothetical protein [Bdellovibrionales bacterium]
MQGEHTSPHLEHRIAFLEDKIAQIEARNQFVEQNKGWETSGARIFLIVIITYLLAALLFVVIGTPGPLRNALIPTLGYFLSTQTLRSARRIWERKLQP